jgi:hypothetical protein
MQPITRSLTCLAVVALLACGVAAQEKDPRVNPPIMPIGVESSSKAPGEASGPPAPAKPAVTPDQEPLSSGNWLGLGFWDGGRSYLVGGFSLNSGFDTNSQNTANGGWQSRSSFNARVGMQRVWSRSQFNLNYSIGGQLYNSRQSAAQRNGALVQSLGVSQSLSWRRWSLSLSESFTYLPESSFGGGVGAGSGFGNGGFGGLGGFGIPGLTIPGTPNPFVTPGQTILTTRGARISNSIGGQVGYSLSPRSQITANGAFSMLRFLEGNFIETNSMVFSAGYNYVLNSKDTIATRYVGQQMTFLGATGGVNAHNFHLSYARRVTGRMSFQISGGPAFNEMRSPLGNVTRRQSWSGMTGWQYAWPNLNVGASYSRSITDGSGVLSGANTHSVSFNVGRRLSQMWSGGASIRFAHNSSLSGLNGGTPASFESWNFGVRLSRPLGRSMSLNTSYNMQHQSRSVCALAGSGCIPTSLRHVFSVGFSWQMQPIGLE